jgi:iron complex outermembrane receptor protein
MTVNRAACMLLASICGAATSAQAVGEKLNAETRCDIPDETIAVREKLATQDTETKTSADIAYYDAPMLRLAQGNASEAPARASGNNQDQNHDTTESDQSPASKSADKQAKLEEVTVTAQRHAENLQDVPIAITAMTGAELETKGITTLAGVAASTPGITVADSPSKDALDIHIRGMGSVDAGGSPLANTESAVGLYEDGFFIALQNGVIFDLADVDRVEVLRGPQGTLYGMNTTGGAINIISKQPSGEFGVKQTLDFGSLNLFRSLTSINLPRWGGLSAKVTVLDSSQDGYVKNVGNGHDYNESAQKAARLQLHWEHAASFSADYFAELARVNWTQGYLQDGTAPRADTAAMPADVAVNKDKIQMHGLTLTWDVSHAMTMKSLTGYRDVIAPLRSVNDFFGSVTLQDDTNTARQFSQEIQFLGDVLDNRIQYVGGLYYFDETSTGKNFIILPSFGIDSEPIGRYKSKSKAAYGQLTWTPGMFDRRLDLTLGGRYTKDERAGTNFDQIANIQIADLATSFHSFNPAFIVNYKWTDDLRSYAKATTGYKAGGVFFNVSGVSPLFKPEHLTTYEVGLKSDWLEHRLRLNTDVFYSKYKDMQQVIPTAVLLDAAAFNLGRATIKGLDLEILAQPLDDLTLNVSYTYLDPRIDYIPVIAGTIYDHRANPGSPFNIGDNIADLSSIPDASRNSVAVAGDYTFLHFAAGDLGAHVDYRWQSLFYVGTASTGPAVGQRDECGAVGSHGTVSARLTWSSTLSRGQRATCSVWGKNLADNRHQQIVFYGTDGGIPGNLTSKSVFWSEPLSYGVSLGWEF